MVEDPTMATSGLDAFFQSQPYLAAFLTCSVKAGTADLLAQKQILSPAKSPPSPEEANESHPFDLPRNLSFIFYGGLVQGMFQQFLFSAVYPVMFGHEHTFLTTVQQVAFDVGVMPFVYLPIVYTIKSLFGASSNGASNQFSLETVQDGLSKLGDDIINKGLLKTYWSIWIPAQSLTFSVIPPHLRVLFVALVSFCWVTILSSISSSTPVGVEASAKATPTAPSSSNGSRAQPSLPSAEGLLEAIQRGADALKHEAKQPLQRPARRPAYVAVSAAPNTRPMDDARDHQQ
jgi:protein Mpv17